MQCARKAELQAWALALLVMWDEGLAEDERKAGHGAPLLRGGPLLEGCGGSLPPRRGGPLLPH